MLNISITSNDNDFFVQENKYYEIDDSETTGTQMLAALLKVMHEAGFTGQVVYDAVQTLSNCYDYEDMLNYYWY